MTQPAPDWYPDPLGRHDHRYWDGTRWTEHVADQGIQAVDPLPGATAPTGVDADTDTGTDLDAASDGADDLPSEGPDDAVAPFAEVGDTGGDQGGPVVVDQPAPVAADPTPAAEAPAATAGAVAPPTGPAYGSGGAVSTGHGRVRSELLDGEYAEVGSGERVTRQNRKMLKVTLGEDILARQGAMVAFQGAIDFDYESSGVGRFIKKAITGEGLPLMRVSGRGEVFLAHDADDIHILWLEDSAITVNGRNVLAFEPSLSWDVERVKGVGVLAGGLFNTTLTGTGWIAITTHGTPIALRTDQPTFADVDAAVAWSTSLTTTVNRTVKAKALVGRGSGEAAQLAFQGQGFVIVQASEGPTVPPHSHGSS